jgi:tight adherence protein C
MPLPIADMPVLMAAFAFIAGILFLIGVLNYFRLFAKKGEVIEKIRQAGETSAAVKDAKLSLNDNTPAQKPLLNFLSFLGKRVSSDKSVDYSKMRLKFLKAGIRRTNAVFIFWGAKCMLAIILLVSFLFVRLMILELLTLQWTLICALSLVSLGLYLPEIWLRFRKAKRKDKILAGLPDALDLLVVCVEAGMGLDAAIQRVAEEIFLSNPLLSDELKLLNLELRAGKARKDALRNLALRTDLEEVNSLVTLLVQTDKFGTSIAQALRVYSDSFRIKRFQKAEEIAAKLPVKLVVPMIFFIFPALFVAVLGAAMIRVFETFVK